MQRASKLTKNRSARYRDFKAACHDASVEHKKTFKLLLNVLEELADTSFPSSIAKGVEMDVFIGLVIRFGLALINILQTRRQLSQYLEGDTNKSLRQRVESDIKKLKQRQTNIKGYLKDMSRTILEEVDQLKGLLKAEDYIKTQLKFTELVGHFDKHTYKIDHEIKEYETIRRSLEPQFQGNSNEDEMRLMHAIGAGVGTLGSVAVAVAMMTNPITAVVGGLAGISFAGGLIAGLRSAGSQQETSEPPDLLNENPTENQKRPDFHTKTE